MLLNVLVLVRSLVVPRFALWICAGVLVACIARRSVMLSLTRGGGSAWRASAHRLPPMWQQFFDSAVQLCGQPREHVLEVGPGIMPVELGRVMSPT